MFAVGHLHLFARLGCGTMLAMVTKVVSLDAGPAPDATEAETLAKLMHAATRMGASSKGIDPRDIAHEAFLRLRPRIAAGQTIGEGYLWRTAYSVLIDTMRREQAEDRRRKKIAAVEPGRAPSPESRAHGREIGAAIHECVDGLVEDRKTVVVLHLQGHGAKEVSTLLAWQHKRVENLLHRGLKALRRCLSGKGFEP